jgi:DNA polymerase III epsilon subunit family exonuclease
MNYATIKHIFLIALFATAAMAQSCLSSESFLDQSEKNINPKVKTVKKKSSALSAIDSGAINDVAPLSVMVPARPAPIAVTSASLCVTTAHCESAIDVEEALVKGISSLTVSHLSTKVPRAVACLNFVPFQIHPSLRENPALLELFLRSIPSDGCLIFFDTETTGLSEQYDRIIEAAFVFRNYCTMQEKRWYALINPLGKKSGLKAYEAHKIPDHILRHEKTFEQLVDPMMAFIGDYPLIAHNAQFDRRMLNRELLRLAHSPIPDSRFECTLKIARLVHKGEKNNLSAVCERYEIDLSSRDECHGAMQDSLLLADMYPLLKLSQIKL